MNNNYLGNFYLDNIYGSDINGPALRLRTRVIHAWVLKSFIRKN